MYFWKQKNTEQLKMCGQACCLGGQSSTLLDVHAWYSHIATSKLHSKTSCCLFDQRRQIPCDNSYDIKEKKLIWTWHAFPDHSKCGNYHCNKCCLVQGHEHKPMTNYWLWHWRWNWVISCCNFQLIVDSHVIFFLVTAEQSLYKLCSNAIHIQNVWQDALHWTVQHSYNQTSII